MQTLRRLCAPWASLCIAGNAKNAGKTTVLNALITAHQGLTLGVSSIGLDGEELDAITRLPKPRVRLLPGSLLATAEGCLKQTEAGLDILERTELRTALGKIVIAKVISAGNCLLGGPASAEGMALAQAALRHWGAEKLFIDGAFARQSHAVSAEALIYVVGAHRAAGMDRVVASAGLALRRFALPGATGRHLALLAETRPGWLDGGDGFHPLIKGSALALADALLDQVPGDARWLFLPGALDAQLAARLVARRKEHGFGLLVQSAVSLVMGDAHLEKLFRLGREIRVLRPLEMAVVAFNPVSPAGHRFDSAAFRQALQQVTDLPLINVAEDVKEA